jgi:cyanocobalamin reductase (cyanide-eliminating) / alkylcobalamin dealkylase
VHRFDAHRVLSQVGLSHLVDPAHPFGILVGNTRALWQPFLAARNEDTTLEASSDPVELYTERVIGAHAATLGASVYYSHRRYGDAYLPFQRIADAGGLAALAPTQLLIHPIFGPWFALRALLLGEGAQKWGPTPFLPTPFLGSCTCDARCTSAFEAAQAATGPDAWRAWLAVRDACPVGREFRYSDAQLAYHYTKDPRFLG